jgi:hypothetical protein
MSTGKRPLEWRGQPFAENDLYGHVEACNNQSLSLVKRKRCFQYLVAKSFVRSVNQFGSFTLTGQGAIWLKFLLSSC